ncbi:MAG: ATP-binding protein [Eubacteriales bacterium]|nr:ATP-binding protein [Eubacteriales bacterium]
MNMEIFKECLLYYGVYSWAAGLVFLLPLKRRSRLYMRLLLSGLCFTGVLAPAAGLIFSRTGEDASWAVALVLIFLYVGVTAMIGFCAATKKAESWYCGVWAAMLSLWTGVTSRTVITEFFGWQDHWAWYLFQTMLAASIFVLVGITIARMMPENGSYRIGPRQMTLALALYVMFGGLYLASGSYREHMAGICVLEAYCVTVLYLQNVLFKKSYMEKELGTIQLLWHQRRDQYRISKESIDLINQKCHDLKHQVNALRAVENDEDRKRYLKEMESSVQIYTAMVRTGNEILDTILTEKSLLCEDSGIRVSCVADGTQLAFMDPMDLYAFFGNALDNSIDAVRQIDRKENRVIDIQIYRKGGFLTIQIANPVRGSLTFEDGLPLTTKEKNGYHGFGLKSMRYTIHKYVGYMTTEVKDRCFYLRAMVPAGREEIV